MYVHKKTKRMRGETKIRIQAKCTTDFPIASEKISVVSQYLNYFIIVYLSH